MRENERERATALTPRVQPGYPHIVDFRMKHRQQLRDFWNYPRDPVLQSIKRNIEDNNISSVCVLVGPYGVGKTTIARTFGMWTACQKWRMSMMPCGDCYFCRTILQLDTASIGGYHELDCASPAFSHQFQITQELYKYEIKNQMTDRPTDNPRPSIVFLDEAHRLSSAFQQQVFKAVASEDPSTKFVFATPKIERLSPFILSKAALYELAFPSPEEAAEGLLRIAQLEGMRLEVQAAHRIAVWARGNPRNCLDVLNKLQACQESITVTVVDDLLGVPTELSLGPSGNNPHLPRPYY